MLAKIDGGLETGETGVDSRVHLSLRGDLSGVVRGEFAEVGEIRRKLSDGFAIDCEVGGVAGVDVAARGELGVLGRADDQLDLVDDFPRVIDPVLVAKQGAERSKSDPGVDTGDGDNDEEKRGNNQALGSSGHEQVTDFDCDADEGG